MVLLDYPESLNLIFGSLYEERVVLHIKTAKFVPNNSELASLFIQLQQPIRSILFIYTYELPTGLQLAQENDEIDLLLIENELEASEFHEKHHINGKDLKNKNSTT